MAMNPITIAQVKRLILKTLERRNAVTERDLLQIPELRQLGKDKLPEILKGMVDSKDIMFLEFVHEDLPGTVHTLYFPIVTVVFEPGLTIKDRVIPDHIETFFQKMMARKVLEKEFVDGLNREGKIEYYEALHKYVQGGGKLDAKTARTLLERLVIEGKVTLRADHLC
jgi:hypothetical protein